MLESGKGLISEQLSIVLVCKEMKWGYETYSIQPSWFIDALNIVHTADAEYANRMAKAMDKQR